MKKINMFINRTVFMIFMMLLEAIIILGLFKWFKEKVVWVDHVLRLLGIVIVLLIVKNSKRLSADLMWIIGI